jgi:hypothetical protein
MPMDAASLPSFSSSSMLSRAWPGMELIGSRTPRPWTTKRGSIRSSTRRVVSRTMCRSSADSRSRRGRYTGYGMAQLLVVGSSGSGAARLGAAGTPPPASPS